MMKICVVIPAYNEEVAIGNLVKELKALGIDVIVINDGSTDKTEIIARENGAKVFGWKKNMGKGVALRCGFRLAKDSDYDGVVTMDADGQHKAEDIIKFIEAASCSNADMIIGNRMTNVYKMPHIRQLVNGVMSCILSRIIHQRIPDSQCGYRFVRRDALAKMHLSSCNYEIESELLLEAARQGMRVLSIPILTIYQGSLSYINPVADTFRFIRLLIKKRYLK